MRRQTQTQLSNAIYSNGPKNYVFNSSYTNPNELKTSSPMSYREAMASAKATREAAGWATVERVKLSDKQWLVAIGPCGK